MANSEAYGQPSHLQEVGLGLVADAFEPQRAKMTDNSLAWPVIHDAPVRQQQNVIEQVIHLHTS